MEGEGVAMENQDCNITPLRRKRLETQGYKGYSDSELHDFKFGIRFYFFGILDICNRDNLTSGCVYGKISHVLSVSSLFLSCSPQFIDV
jgi:hypothetical protein